MSGRGLFVREILAVNKATLGVIARFPSASAASRETGIDASTILRQAERRSLSRGIVIWRFSDNYSPMESFAGKVNRPLLAVNAKTGERFVAMNCTAAASRLGLSRRAVSDKASAGKTIGDWRLSYAR